MGTELQKVFYAKSEDGVENSGDDESEDLSTDEEMRVRRRLERREEKRRVKELAWMAGVKKDAEHRKMLLAQRTLAEEEISMDVDVDMGRTARLANLVTPAGR